ncbi:MAG: chemotaxis protein CheA [Ignavibacteriae bacterium HGW-Ignavibacteriae-3]|nr:MAG: chemotaxis protein CheA [Ignavibacteriae bacterium HGW-Ignavibacteriae-3]
MSELNQNPTLIDPDMKEIVESFLIETKEILEKLDFDLLELEKRPDDADLLNKIFRSFHTIKGTSGFLGLEKLPLITHKCEDILNKLRKGELKLSIRLMDGIILGYDTIRELLNKIEFEQNEDYDISGAAASLEVLIGEIENGNLLDETPLAINTTVMPNEFKSEAMHPNENTQGRADSTNDEIAKKSAAAPQTNENTIRIDVNRLDALLDIVSELVLGRNRLAEVSAKFGIEHEGTKYSKEFGEVAKQIDLMTTELQLVVMKLRMIKIAKIFNRYPRLVRDISKEMGKEVELIIKGEETEVDKNLIEEINDPLVHLIRNSIDHGVEGPEKRIKAGKNKKGKVTLSAEHLGNNVIITIEDDGNGIDPDVIREKAIEKGLITRERTKELSRQEVMALIFLPGFSTAERVSNVSGRGVGMDVVKTNVAKLRGIINIESEPGIRTKISLKLPLTLAIISGMIVKVDGDFLVIPLGSVIEVLRVNKNQLYSVNSKPVIKLRDSVLPLVTLDHLLTGKVNGKNHEEKEWQYIVEIGVAEKRYGIKVDELIGQQEVVIKSLGSYLGKIDGVAGSTIMGDGTVVMILDVNELFIRMERNS